MREADAVDGLDRRPDHPQALDLAEREVALEVGDLEQRSGRSSDSLVVLQRGHGVGQVATDLAVGQPRRRSPLGQLGPARVALDLRLELAARVERAARRQVEQAGRRALDRLELGEVLASARASTGAGRRCRASTAGRARSLASPFSTPRPAYITRMSSAVSATTARSCVMRMTAEPNSFWRSLTRSRICACTVTSSAVVGSSAMSSFGLLTRPRAIIARWRMPPENSWGYWLARRCGLGMPTRSSISTARFCATCLLTLLCAR